MDSRISQILMNWSRACWSNRRNKLFGSRKDRYSIQRHRLQLHVNNWYDAPRTEALIDRFKLADRQIVLSKNKGAIAKWLDRQFEDRAKAMKTINQRTGQTSIFSFMLPLETRRQNNSTFQTRLQEARRAALLTSSNTVDDVFPFHSYIQDLILIFLP